MEFRVFKPFLLLFPKRLLLQLQRLIIFMRELLVLVLVQGQLLE